MSGIEEIVVGKKAQALCLTSIGNEFRKDFDNIALPHFVNYCKKYGLGLLVLKDFLDNKKKLRAPYNTRPNLQRLLFPEAVANDFRHYKYLCDIDVDCLPGPVARDIFDHADNGNIQEDTIYLTLPTPNNFSRTEIGKRLSLLRKKFHQQDFPLDSLLSGGDADEKKIYNLKFNGPIATIGTCMASTNLLARSYKRVYDAIKTDFTGYLQHYTNHIFREEAQIAWLPYEFQAIWNFEVALYYPFLFSNNMKHLARECVLSSLLRVDMLHFAGSWKENKVFKEGPFLDDPKILENYFLDLPEYLLKKLFTRSYGKLKNL